MKKQIAFFTLLLLGLSLNGQTNTTGSQSTSPASPPTCTPDPIYANEVWGLWPDTLDDLPCGLPGVYYESVVNLKIPTNATQIDPNLPSIGIDSLAIDNIAGLPSGMTWTPNITPAIWPGAQQGCVVIHGTPPPGIYDLTINTIVSLSTITYPYDFEGYRLVIDAGCGAPALTANITQTAISCYGVCDGVLSANVSGGTPPYTYNWNNGTTSQSLSNACAGVYSVTIQDSNGTSVIVTNTLTGPTLLMANTGSENESVSTGDGMAWVSTTGGTPPYTTAWNTGSNTDTIQSLSVGIYQVTITDQNGCSTTSAAYVNSANCNLSISLNGERASTQGGSDGSAEVIASGGTLPYTYLWNNSQANSSLDNLTTGTYSVTVTDAQGCIEIGSIFIADGFPSNVKDQSNYFSTRIYPNPAKEEVNIVFSKALTRANIYIVNAIGEVVVNNLYTNVSTVAINIENLTPGWYVLKTKSETEIHFAKLLIQ